MGSSRKERGWAMAVLAECPMGHRRQSIRSKRCMSKNGKRGGADLEKAKRSGKVKYWIAYRLPGGKQRFEKLTGERATSIEYARDGEAKRKVQKRENRIFDIKPEVKMTFKELSEWYLGLEMVKGKAYFRTVQYNLASFNKVFGETIVRDIKAEALEEYQAKRKALGLSHSYIDQEIGAARGMINKALDNDLVGGDTIQVFKKVKKLLKRNSNARDKIISLEQFKALLESQRLPFHTRGILATAFYTGMRRGEILFLTWPKVDMRNRAIRLEARDTKDGEARMIPICDELYEVLRIIPRAIHDDHVFLYRGKPVRDIRAGLKEACEDVGISYGRSVQDGFVFHDLRHCFNIYMRKAAAAESVIMRMTGHSSREMFDRHNRVDEEDMK